MPGTTSSKTRRRTVALADLRRVLLEESAVRVVARLKSIVYPEPPPTPPALPQLVFWTIDAEGLPPRPWRTRPGDVFDCAALGCEGITVGQCVARQVETEAQRTEQVSRGQGTEHPSCDWRKCAQGRAIWAALDPDVKIRWEGAGPGGRFKRAWARGPRSVEGSDP